VGLIWMTARGRGRGWGIVHYTGTQEGYWTKAARPIYPDLDCRILVQRIPASRKLCFEVIQKLLACPMFIKTVLK